MISPRTLAATLWLLIGSVSAQPLPEAGLRAEGQGQWAAAVDIYQQALQANPTRVDLWERLSDIYATRLKAPGRAAEALQEALKHAPQDARLYAKLSQAHAMAGNGPAALAAIDRALVLDPANLAYLRARAEIAAWTGDAAIARDSHERILVLAPGDAAAGLGLARAAYRSGQLDKARAAYRAYLSTHPEDAAAWLESAKLESELGDHAEAMELLDPYRTRFGEDIAWRKQRSRALALAARPTPALALVAELEPGQAEDEDLVYTRTVALHHARRAREALASLADVVRLRPGAKDTMDIERFIRTPLRSSATVGLAYHTDSDGVAVRRAGVEGQYGIDVETRLFGGADRQRISAPAGSGFEKPDGGTVLDYDRAWLGIRHRVSPTWAFDAQAGGGRATAGHVLYELGVDFQPGDAFAARLWRRQDLYAVSPRAAALGIEQRANVADVSWAPDLRWVIAGRIGHATYSDDNARWEASLAPRRAILRSQYVNLDLGVSARWFGFERDPGHGYYAPSRYERYALTAFTYWKISDDDGLSIVLSHGPYKDSTFPGFRSGSDAHVEGFFGIYRDWYLNVKAGYSNYAGSATGAYRSRGFALNLTRRF